MCPGQRGDNALEVQPSRSLADAGGSETCAGTVRCTGVERSTLLEMAMSVPIYMDFEPPLREGGKAESAKPHTNEGNVIFHVALGCEALRVGEATEGRDARKYGVGLVEIGLAFVPTRQATLKHTCVPPSPGSVLYQSDW